MSSQAALDRARNAERLQRKEAEELQRKRQICKTVPAQDWAAQVKGERTKKRRRFFQMHTNLVEAGHAPRAIARLLKRGFAN